MFVVVEYLLAELVDKLIEAEVELSLNFIVQELLSKVVKGVVARVTIQVQWVQDVPGWGRGMYIIVNPRAVRMYSACKP